LNFPLFIYLEWFCCFSDAHREPKFHTSTELVIVLGRIERNKAIALTF